MTLLLCPVHGIEMVERTSEYGVFHICPLVECDILSGHKKTSTPANKETRAARAEAHAAIDPIWRAGRKSRNQCYLRMSLALSISVEETHIGMFTIEQCRAVIELAAKMAKEPVEPTLALRPKRNSPSWSHRKQRHKNRAKSVREKRRRGK